MTTRLLSQESKDIKEITLYNFTTLRNPEYINKEALKNNLNFICYDHEYVLSKKDDVKGKLKSQDFDPSDFLDFEEKLFHNPAAGNKTTKNADNEIVYSDENKYDEDDLPIILNNFFDKIFNIYKTNGDDFYKVNQLLLGEDVDKSIKIELKNEKLFQEKVWRSLVYNLKSNNDFKEKEIATNLLRYFHLKKYRYLIDDESKGEKKENFDKLINAQIIIPEELFPKSETFFYGEKSLATSRPGKPNQLFIYEHYLKVLQLKRMVADAKDISIIETIDKRITEAENKIREEEKKPQNEIFSQTSYIATIELIDLKSYLLVSIFQSDKKLENAILDARLKFKTDFLTTEENNPKTQNLDFSNEKDKLSENIKESVTSNWDLFFNLTEFKEFDLVKENANDFKFSLDVKYKNKDRAKTKGILILQIDEIKYEGYGLLDNNTDFYGKAFKPSGFGIQMLGFADYRKVVSTISRYIPAEVAHIENVMASEFREKVTTKELTTEITEFESTENETEKLNETSTNDRFQMQNEVANILNDQRNSNVNTNFTAGGAGYSASLTTGNSTTNTKEESNKQAITNAKEITNKAVEKIVSKVKKERTVKVTEKFIDVNKYGFDNRGHNEHVSGVYRHINAVYRNRIHNYGKRLTYEFSIPEPALVHKKGVEEDDYDLISKINQIDPPKPTNPHDFIETYEDLNKDNYTAYKKMFGVELDDYPKKNYREFYHSFNYNSTSANIDKNQSITVKFDGFIPVKYNINSKRLIGNWGVQVGNDSGKPGWLKISLDNLIIYSFVGNRYGSGNDKDDIIYSADSKILYGQQQLVLTTQGHYVDDFNFEFEIEFIASREQIQTWQKSQYKKILDRYKILLDDYEKKLKAEIEKYTEFRKEKTKSENERNRKQPSNLRQIEIISLKRNCLSYLMDEENEENLIRKFGTDLYKKRKEFTDILIDKSHKLDEYTAFVRFLEQAFEWNDMSYTFYPYYWGADNKEVHTWKDNYNEDYGDPLFKTFMQAGMARVIVTVRKGWEDAVNLYMTTGKIWQGGNLPVYGSSLFISIADELKDDKEYVIEGEWESVLPTNLIALQNSGVAIIQEGLPNLDDNGNLGKLEDNPEKLPTGEKPKRKKFLGIF